MAGGRPTKYKPEFVEQGAKLAAKGFTDTEIADFFNVAVSTIYLWKVQHPEFSEALTTSKEAADQRVERALYERALGYSHPETHVSNYQGQVTLTPLRKHYPPDAASMIFWLKNRRPDLWRDKPEGSDDDAPAPSRVEVTIVSGRKRADA
ncbi:helix-turn-helix domain-containing protein [Xanthomonas sacchari]|uniref:helix-turn-helix domain-containing protein n=1 Tax=Xanthomonas sacchari TaxID=56458 RepID=UPI00225AD27A|nr:helix-turn-helix domain-containing protein [Xanthomonas sacchari]MCW0413491.1 hypothetical protein [Xanthomonas sacchari]UYK67808.1 helix-turn-helix domain-containing protein [Xanthomonas sacchari]